MTSHLGNGEPVCPHCSGQLTKMPARKVKCRYCGNDIYVRTRPTDRVRVLVTAADAVRIEEEWNWRPPTPRPKRPPAEEFRKEAATLAARFGRAPSDVDVCWSLANKQLLLHAGRSDWGLYRNVRFDMAELLRCEEKNRQALDVYLEVSYLDANGPRNMGGVDDCDLIKDFPPFSSKLALQAPFVIEVIAKLARLLAIGDSDIESVFLLVASSFRKHINVPVAPRAAWECLRDELAKIRVA